jgi:hypothetical protein
MQKSEGRSQKSEGRMQNAIEFQIADSLIAE